MFNKYNVQIIILIVAGSLLFIGEFYQSPDAWKYGAVGYIAASVFSMAWYELKARRAQQSTGDRS